MASVVRTFSADDIDFTEGASTVVVSDSPRFILPVPKLQDGGEPLVMPGGGKPDQPFVDVWGRPRVGRGIVFFNPDDQCWQAALGDGSAVVIIGPVTEAQNTALLAMIEHLSPDAERLTLSQLKDVIHFATSTLKVRAAYDSTRRYVADRMTPCDAPVRNGVGLHRRRAHDFCRAVFVPGGGRFLGPAATPQVFKDGAVILKLGDDIRLLQVKSFEACYRCPDGRPLRVTDLRTQNPGH